MRRPEPLLGARARLLVLASASALVVAACAGSPSPSATPSVAPTAAVRVASTAQLTIVAPKNGAQLSGTSVHVEFTLNGARIVNTTTTDIRPDEGHIHLYVNNALVSMNYGIQQDIPVTPGTYVLRAEFVASDHAPFNPRVWSQQVYFTVTQ